MNEWCIRCRGRVEREWYQAQEDGRCAAYPFERKRRKKMQVGLI